MYILLITFFRSKKYGVKILEIFPDSNISGNHLVRIMFNVFDLDGLIQR